MFIILSVTSLPYFLLPSVIFGILAIAFFISHKNYKSKFIDQLIITPDQILGKRLNRSVNIPVNQISSIATAPFNGVRILTSSACITFDGLLNQMEVYHCLSDLLKKQQEHIQVKSTQNTVGFTEELIELKKLLDSGIITQEEFDAKKKQLLGL